ncbi:MFS transporter [Philodulcilactobacillus myokoensis]|uniref:MFS transporter n=1 Tax=Philodulcilactobacillus myokoensis TaxID=2929573 RepID=A0A9W6B299_9LACO|nr:MFS transporter [Philodulcilactobacillus myokoensis]GLB47486.1 MFS transporter [Philodulcilactobacillus myokoensis]
MDITGRKVNVNQITKKHRLSMSLFLNYFVHGMVLVVLTQNMMSLAHSWETTLSIVSYVISGIGIGRLIAYPITGYLSDRINRKIFILFGMLCYFIFLIATPFASNFVLAYFLSILSGFGNSALDTGTYTTLVEINHGSGRATVLLKAFISLGDFLLPLVVAFLSSEHLWFGFSFMIPATVLFFNFINLLNIKFPKIKSQNEKSITSDWHLSKLRRVVSTAALMGYGYTSMALMLVFTQWITLYGERVLNLNNLSAHFLLSLYSIGSIIGVITLSILLKRESREIPLLVILNFATLISLLIILISKLTLITDVASMIFGFSAAGGVMQTGLTIFMQLFPKHRGAITGIFYFFGSIASLTIPLVTGMLSQRGITFAFNFNLIIAAVSVILALITMLSLGQTKEDTK